MWDLSTGETGKTKEQLFWEYEIRKCIYWIMFNNYQKVCLQFPDDMLLDSYDIAYLIEKKTNKKAFVMGDTTYGSCCVDNVNARHAEADSIIHFGRACLTSEEDIPTLYVLPKATIDITVFCRTIIEFSTHIIGDIILLYDISYSYIVDKIVHELAILRSKIRVSRLDTPQHNREGLKWSSSDVLVSKFGRVYSIPNTAKEDDLTYVYLLDRRYMKNMLNFIFLHPGSSFYRYECDNAAGLELCASPEIAKRRLFLVQKVREASKIGILICTLTAKRHLEAVERVRGLCKARKKKSYIVSVGKINVPKLANFPEIDVFVMIGCPEVNIPEEDFYQPIVTITEVELALNNNEIWWQKDVSDYREFLPGGRLYKEIDRTTDSMAAVEVSLLGGSNRTIVSNLVDTDMIDVSENAIADRDSMIVSQTGVNGGLAGRSWQGLQLNIGDSPVEKAATGFSGTPSEGYQHPSTSGLT